MKRVYPRLIALLAGITLLAAFLRLYRLDLVDYRFDQAFPLQYAQDIVNGRWWAAQPHGSVGAHPAMFLYVLALGYLFTKNFVAILVYRILLDVIAVPLTWLIGERYFNRRVGVIAALLFAVAPWSIQFARNLGVVVFPAGLALALIGALEMVQRKNAWGWMWLGWGISLVAGAHFSGLEILPAVLVAMWLGRKTFKPLPAVLGALPVLFVFANFVAYDAPLQFQNARAYLAGAGEAAANAPDMALRMARMVSGGYGISDLTGKSFAVWQAQTPALQTALDDAQALWLAGAFVFCGALSIRAAISRKPAALGLVWLWMALPIAFLVASSRAPVLHYLLVILPAPFLLMAYAADKLMRVSRATGVAMALLVGAVAISQMDTLVRFNWFVDGHDTTGGLGLPARGVLFARNKITPNGGDVIAVIKGFPTPWNENAAMLRGVLGDVPHRFLNSESDGFVMNSERTQFVFAPDSVDMLKDFRRDIVPGYVYTASLPGQAGSASQFVYAQFAPGIVPAFFLFAPKATFANGAQMTNYSARYSTSTNKLLLDVIFGVTATPPEGVDYHWYAHVFEDENKVGQADIAGVHPSSWRAGDILVLRFEIDAPPNTTGKPRYIRLGSYTYPDIKPVMVSLPDKAPEGGVNLMLR